MKNIPPLDSFSDTLPTYRAKKAEINAKIATLKAECAVIREQINKGALDPGNDQQVRARQLLGEDVSIIPASIERLSQAQRELAVLGTALSINDGKIQTEERVAGNKQREAVQPEIDRLGNNLTKALFATTHPAHLEYELFVDKLEEAGGNVSTLRISPGGLKGPRDLSGFYWYAARDLIDAGFMSKSDLPKVFE